MRENMGLYRGKRMDNSAWVEGSFLLDGEAHRPADKEHLPFSKCYIVPETDRDNIKTSFSDGSLFLETKAYHVIPETVGQYTGLTDKNGKRIFEGDILKIARKSDGLGRYYSPSLDYPTNVVVKWDMCAWMWETICNDKYYISFPEAWCHFECEVIGNVHDNKELLNPPEQNGLKVWEVWIEGKNPNGPARFLGEYHAKTFEIACDLACLEHFQKRCYLSGGRPCYLGFRLFDKKPELLEVK